MTWSRPNVLDFATNFIRSHTVIMLKFFIVLNYYKYKISVIKYFLKIM